MTYTYEQRPARETYTYEKNSVTETYSHNPGIECDQKINIQNPCKRNLQKPTLVKRDL